jgi:acetylornithine/N-succinyldiaminopimelate aminotransferase
MNTTTTEFSSLKIRADNAILNTYARFPVAFVRGEGRQLFDTEGKRYLDFAGGIAVNSLGHGNPRIASTLFEQSSLLTHVSNLYYTEPGVKLAERLIKLFGPGRIFFCNSGAEANEGLYKMARKFGEESQKFEIITAINSFHGRTLGGIAATGQDKIKKGFAPIIPGFSHVPFNDLNAFEKAITDKTAAILIEGIQGEGGITPATPEFLIGLRKLCDERGLLLLFDAVQCGHFRTGRFQSYERILEGHPEGASFRPDAVSFAKAIGAGFPMGGFWLPENRIELFQPGSHGTTFGGTPLACSVANTVLDIIEEEGLQSNTREMGGYLADELRNLIPQFPNLLDEVRGFGFMLGLQLKKEAAEFKHEKLTPAQIVISRLLESGLLVVPSGETVLRFLPPLNTTTGEIDECVSILKNVLIKL